MNKAMSTSRVDGQAFLAEALAAEQQVLAVQLELSAKSITHDGVMGEVNEQHFIDFLRRHLPARYQVDKGIVIDSLGNTSDQIDIIIFDHQYTPTLLDQQAHRFIPAEAVYCVLEAKPRISKQYLAYAADKAESVRVLHRTSVSILSAAGEHPPRPLFPIISGIIAGDTGWKGGLASPAFRQALAKLQGNRALDCGVALRDRSFNVVNGQHIVSGSKGSLAVFLFSLLQRLQALGTVPAVDWTSYASVFGKVAGRRTS